MAISRAAVRRLSLGVCRRWTHTTTASLRSKQLSPVREDDLVHFSRILPASSILSTLPPASCSSDDLSPYNTDWMGKYKGKASTVLRPRTTQEVSDILKWCWVKRIGVVPQGGNTGLVGGSVPLGDELVINLGSMNKVRSFDPVTGML